MARLLIVCLVSTTVACSESGVTAASHSGFESELVRVGYANESPFAFVEAGQLTGEAPEVARRVLLRMGVKQVKGVLTEFGSLVPGLKAQRFELIAAGMFITPDRCKQVAFSEPTYCISEALLVRHGNPFDLHAYESLKGGTARLGVVRGTVQHGYAESLGVAAERIVLFPDPPSALAGLTSGRVDAFAATTLTVGELLHKLGKQSAVERAAPFADPVIDGRPVLGCGAFAFRLADAAQRDEFNRYLSEFLGGPEHLDAVRPFGLDRGDLPPAGVTTSSLCKP